jgi:hypothetical protein
MRPLKPSCPGKACSQFEENKYGLKKPGDFTVSKGHRYPLVHYNESKHNTWYLQIILQENSSAT